MLSKGRGDPIPSPSYSENQIAEMLLQGTNMGIIEGRKLLNNKLLDKKVSKLIEEFVSMQEECVEILKEYL